MSDAISIEMLRTIRADVQFPTEPQVAAARQAFLNNISAESTPARVAYRPRKSVGAIAIAILLIALTVGAAVATISHFSDPLDVVHPGVTLGELDHVRDLEIFKSPSIVPFAGTADAEKIGDAHGIDPATARAVPMPGSTDHIWLIATDDDKLCVFSPANGGFNSACGGPEVISETGMFGIPSGADEASRVAISIAPNGTSGLTIKSVNGTTRVVRPERGVAVAHVEGTDLVSNGAVTVNVDKMPTAGSRIRPLPRER